MKQQTAVEWLIEKLKKNDIAYGMFDLYNHDEIFEQAKQMEKEQIILAATEMKREVIGNTLFNKEMKFKNGEEYYDEIYKTK